MEDIDKVLAALGLKFVNLVVAVVTSFVSLRFFDGLATRDRWITFVGGVAIAAWGGGPTREFLELKPGIEIGFVLLFGLFGMALAAELLKLVRETNWGELIKSIFSRKNGG